MSPEIVNSWKEIAAYLGRGVRTVQRWEAELGLPVRRPRGKERSAVIALRSDLDRWLQHAPQATLNARTPQPELHARGEERDGAHIKLKKNAKLLASRAAELSARAQQLQATMAQSIELASALQSRQVVHMKLDILDTPSDSAGTEVIPHRFGSAS